MIHVSQDLISSVTNPITGEIAHIYRFTLVNDITDMYVQVVSFGAAIYSLRVPDETGKVGDIILGFDYIQEYEKSRNTYFGATIGRVCNRIANGTFKIYDRKFEVTKNHGCNHIHGGRIGFDKVPWNLSEIHDNGVTFSHRSPHGHEGYPGEVFATVRYTIHPDNSLRIYMTAKTNMTTLVNMTNHTYFNLAGHDAGREALYQHTVSIYANNITQTDPDGIPSGIYLPVDSTPYDFRTGENLGKNIQRIEGNKLGFDDNFCVIRDGLDKNALAKVARVTHGPSGRWMEVDSNQPGVQFYTGNFLPDNYKGRPPLLGRDKTPYYKHGGFCLETQKYPDAPNHEHFPSIILRPGELYEHVINFKFGTFHGTAPATKLTGPIRYRSNPIQSNKQIIYAEICTEVESKSKSKSKSEGDSKSELPGDENIAKIPEEEKPHYSGATKKRLKLDLEPVCVLKGDAAKMQEKQTEKAKEKVEEHIEVNVVLDTSTKVETKSKSKSAGGQDDSKSELPEEEYIAEALEEKKPHYTGAIKKQPKLHLEPVSVLRQDVGKMQKKQTEKAKEKVEEHIEVNVVLDTSTKVETKSKSKSAGGQDDSKSELPEEEYIAEALEEKKPHYTGAIKKQPKLHLEPVSVLRQDVGKMQIKQTEKAKEKVEEHIEVNVVLDTSTKVETKSKSKSAGGQDDSKSELPEEENIAEAPEEKKPHYTGAIKKQPKLHLEPVSVLREDVGKMQKKQREKAKEKVGEHLEDDVFLDIPMEVETKSKYKTPAGQGETRSKLPGDEDTAGASQEEKPHYSGAIKKQLKIHLEPVSVLKEDVARMQRMQIEGAKEKFEEYIEMRKKAKEEFTKEPEKFKTPAGAELPKEMKEAQVQTTPTISGKVKKKSVKVQTDPEKEREELEGASGGEPKPTVKIERLI